MEELSLDLRCGPTNLEFQAGKSSGISQNCIDVELWQCVVSSWCSLLSCDKVTSMQGSEVALRVNL